MGSSKLFLALLLVFNMHHQLIKAQNGPQVNRDDLAVAIQEMRRANYFTFVTFINMWSQALISNPNSTTTTSITFFMPKDRALSDSNLNNSSSLSNDAIVSDFLLRHSVPSALLFDHLLRLPTASILPTSVPNYMVQISNGGGRSNFFLNNIKLISPNLCTATSTIRCHGIAGVLPTFQQQQQQQQDTASISCSSSPLSSPSPPPSLHVVPAIDSEIINNAAPAAAPSPVNPPRSAATSTTSKELVFSCILFCFSIVIYAM